ncbi:MAG: serine/threonine protein kinase, partial [Gemmataceae bacterium]|nr:serine/threonine protein kinase [Gemmataceae bacterium]
MAPTPHPHPHRAEGRRTMPAPATVPEFLDLVRKAGLVPDAKLDELAARFRAAAAPVTIDQAATALVRDGDLTFFQSKQLKLGRYKRFTIGSKYRLLELIGAGGMGAVYLCEHTLMRRLVALKVLPVEKLDDQSNLERFYREARAVAALDHPNIVRAYDIDQYERLHFLVMEYVDGTSLQEIVARYAVEKRSFDPIRAAHYIAQAAVGMQHAHELGMVHRDIKPGNLLLDRAGVIKVLDMGLAKFFHKQQDSVTEKYDDQCVLGTADYLAPEQAVTSVVDVRADIYSLGGTLYFMLTGQTPFPDGTIASKLVAHQNIDRRPPKPVEAFRPDVPSGLLAVLRRMMAKEPDDRYQEPIEVAEALAEWA